MVNVAPVASTQSARTVLPSTTVTAPSIPARTRAGRQTRERNRARRSGLPTALGNIRPFSPNG